MTRDKKHRAIGGRARLVRLAIVLAALVGLSLLAAACGGSSGSGGSGSSSGSSSANPAKYSACMRKHGVPNFPDPDSNGHFRLTFGRSANGKTSGIDPNSPQFRAAQRACQKLAPNGGRPSRQQQAQELQQMLRYSACMRSHGVPKFPDPQQGPGGEGILMTIGQGVDPNSPQFKAAQKACQKLVPGAASTIGPSSAS